VPFNKGKKNIVSVSNLCEKAKQKKKSLGLFLFSLPFPSQLFSQTVQHLCQSIDLLRYTVEYQFDKEEGILQSKSRVEHLVKNVKKGAGRTDEAQGRSS